MDENRANDGTMLRYYYEEETGTKLTDDRSRCSVLEMMVGFSERIDGIMGEPGEDHRDWWFHEMLRNLDLEKEHDRAFDLAETTTTIKNFMRRNIQWNGTGGIFPLNNAHEDQRELSLWDQMSCYMNEHM